MEEELNKPYLPLHAKDSAQEKKKAKSKKSHETAVQS
jgi:hypothetical protein